MCTTILWKPRKESLPRGTQWYVMPKGVEKSGRFLVRELFWDLPVWMFLEFLGMEVVGETDEGDEGMNRNDAGTCRSE